LSFNRPILLVLLVVLLLIGGLRHWLPEEQKAVSHDRILMGTVVTISALAGNGQNLEEAVQAAFSEMSRVEKLMSPHQVGSDLQHLAAPTSTVTVSSETAAVLQQALAISATSSGAFDPTLGGLKELWDIEGEHPRVPTQTEIDQVLSHAGWQKISVQGQSVHKDDLLTQIDLGGIAKGYAIDRAIAVLQEHGVTLASVNAGGDIRLLGQRPDRPWRIGIQHPRQPQALIATLEMQSGAVVTSGDYERFFEADGKRYHHLFDPRSGYPGRLCQSVTITAPDATTADALATAVFILGPQAGQELLKQFPQAAAIIIAADGTALVTSDDLERRLTWQ